MNLNREARLTPREGSERRQSVRASENNSRQTIRLERPKYASGSMPSVKGSTLKPPNVMGVEGKRLLGLHAKKDLDSAQFDLVDVLNLTDKFQADKNQKKHVDAAIGTDEVVAALN